MKGSLGLSYALIRLTAVMLLLLMLLGRHGRAQNVAVDYAILSGDSVSTDLFHAPAAGSSSPLQAGNTAAEPSVLGDYVLSIERCISYARENSAEALAARHSFQSAYWRYRTYRADFRPTLLLTGTLPDFNRRFVRYHNVDGSFSYVEENSSTMGLALSLEQQVPWTGTRLFLQSRLDRTDIFSDPHRAEYLSVPIRIGLTHSFFSVNRLRWDSRIEPKRYEEAQQRYIMEMERVGAQAVERYFQVIQDEQTLAIAELNLANADTLYRISSGRYSIGRIAENDLLQMELNLLNAEQSVNAARVALQLSRFKLFNYLGLRDDLPWVLETPYVPKVDSVSFAQVLEWTMANHPSVLEYDRREMEARRGIAEAKAAMGFEVRLEGSYGLTQSSKTLPEVYTDPIDQQGVRLSITVPILDWGKGKGRVRMAKSNYDLVQTRMEQARIELKQNVMVEVMRYNMLPGQATLAAKADTIAHMRYAITKQRFLIGKVDVLELDKAQVDRDRARQARIASLRDCWRIYFALRQRTLTDLNTGQPLVMDISPAGF